MKNKQLFQQLKLELNRKLNTTYNYDYSGKG
jgi:hypothetical protein